MPVKDYKIRRRVYVPQPDGSKKEKVVYAHSEKQFTEKKNEILAEAGSEEEAGKKYWAEHYTKP